VLGSFGAFAFLTTLREVYEATVIRSGDGGDRAIEYSAFIKMVHARTIFVHEHCLFKLFDLEMPVTAPTELLFEHGDSQYLRLDCLSSNSDG
jgi:hypothetical protein